MIELGKFNQLEVLRETSVGFYLDNKEEEGILLPNKYVPEDLSVGDVIDVFLYKDSEDRIIATTLEPTIILNEFACLKVLQVNSFGAFLDWGLEKDLLVPFDEQVVKMNEGEDYLVYLNLDERTNRLVGSSYLNRYVNTDTSSFSEGDEVYLLIGRHVELGVDVIVNQEYKGLLYRDEIFQQLDVGDKCTGYIKKIREDGKLDVSLKKPGYEENIKSNSEVILNALKENNGFLDLTDKSDPEEIKTRLEMSKKNFKKTIGSLYKQRLIKLEKDGIHLIEPKQ